MSACLVRLERLVRLGRPQAQQALLARLEQLGRQVPMGLLGQAQLALQVLLGQPELQGLRVLLALMVQPDQPERQGQQELTAQPEVPARLELMALQEQLGLELLVLLGLAGQTELQVLPVLLVRQGRQVLTQL